MTILNTSYANWKASTAANGWTNYHIALPESEAVIVIAGTRSTQLVALANNADPGDGSPASTDYADWFSQFQPTSTPVANRDEAIYRIVAQDQPTFSEVDPQTGALAVSIEGIGASGTQSGAPRIEEWPSMPFTLSNSYQTVWNKSGPGHFFSAIFNLSSDLIYFQVLLDGTSLFNLYLDDLHDDYALKAGAISGGDDDDGGSSFAPFPLVEIKSKFWRYRPEVPLRFETSFELQFRKNSSSTRRVNRGICSWGQL